MELIVISKPSFFEEEAALINSLFAEGMLRFHLRKESAERKDFEQLLAAIQPAYLERVALHQFHELAPDFGIQRLHYPAFRRQQSSPAQLKAAPAITLSTSVHSETELTDLENFKYTFYGPVFQSISKKDYPSALAEGFRLPESRTVKVIALGGIELDKISLVKQMNFDGLAILGTLWNDTKQALNTFKKIREKCQTDLL